MPAFNFQKRFVPHILSGRKCHTIRADRKDGRRPKPGETLYLFCGMRTKCCERIAEPVCSRVHDIEIRVNRPASNSGVLVRVFIDGEMLSTDEYESLAYRDGFDSFAEMMKFWDGRLPFKGFITHWRPFTND